jgi:PI-3-kinase-related kinase SMG-1
MTCCCFTLPAGVLRSTFLTLQRESPKQLLSRQLLTAAATPGAWWSSQQCFAASAAVGSMLGWLLGLGDRHLDNLLLDTERGELLHIDFSVCFDKGAGLGVPEVVPFRLTQMMQVRGVPLLLLIVLLV